MTHSMRSLNRRFAILAPRVALLLGLAGCGSNAAKVDPGSDGGVTQPVGNVFIMGATSLDLGAETTYTATVTDATGHDIAGATVTWSANGTVSLSNPNQRQASSVKVRATGVGPGAVSATAGGRTGQIAVRVSGGAIAVASATTMPLPLAIAVGQVVSVKAQYMGANDTKADAMDATWAATGACTTTDGSHGVASVAGTAAGKCTVTATVMSKTASATFDVVNITAVKVTGDQTTLELGGTRVLTGVALSGTSEVSSVQVTWTQTGAAAVTVAPTVNGAVTVTATAVGPATLIASAGAATKQVSFDVAPVSLELAAAGTRVLAGGVATVTVTPKGTGGVVGKFAAAAGVMLAGATGFASVGAATLTDAGLVTFELSNAAAASPAVTATFGAVTSNALAFSIATVQTVKILGPVGPVRVGSTVDLTLEVKDAQGATIVGGAPAGWVDANGVLTVPAGMSAGFAATATVAKLGTSALVATVQGVSSAPFASPGVPGSVTITAPAPASVAVGGTATLDVSVVDVNGAAVAVPSAQLTVTSADPTKVTVDAGAAGANDTVRFTATGVAPAAAPGVTLTATWTGGTETVDSAGVQLVVAGGAVTWSGGACTATPVGARTWRVSGFQGATSGADAIVYDIFAAVGAAATTASTKVAMDGASGVSKDITVPSIAADWRFAVVARGAAGATSGLVACARGATVASSTVAGQAVVLGGSTVYADDTSMAVAATNPRPLLMVATPTSALDRTAPRPSLVFGGGLIGIGVRASDGAQILYKRPGAGQDADASILSPSGALAVAKTDASAGVCASRAGVTAFELAGQTTLAGPLTSFAVYTSTTTATGDAAGCALDVLAFRDGETKTLVSGVDRVAAFGDHRVGYTQGGALYDVDLTSTTNVPRPLATDALPAHSLIAAVNPATGAAGAIEPTSVYVLDPTGVVSRYTVGTPPFVAPVASAATASLAGADGLVAADASTLYVTVAGVLQVVTVSGAGPLTLVVTARDYSAVGAPLPVTLGATAAPSP